MSLKSLIMTSLCTLSCGLSTLITHYIFIGVFSFNSVVLQRWEIFSWGKMAFEIVGKKYGSVGLFLNYEGDKIIEV